MVKEILDCEQSQQLFLRGQMNIRRRNAKHIGEVQDSVRLGWSPLKKGHNARCAAVNIIIMLFHGTWYHYQTLFDQTGYSKTKYHNDSYRNKTIKKPLMHPTANTHVIIHCMTHLILNNELQTCLVRRPWWRRNENEFLPPSISGFAWRHF